MSYLEAKPPPPVTLIVLPNPALAVPGMPTTLLVLEEAAKPSF